MENPLPISTFKVALLGEVNVGKTSIFRRVKTGQFSNDASSTLGLDMVDRDFSVNSGPIRLQIWDTAGSEKYRTLTSNYYRSAAAILYVYDLSEEDSLFGLTAWLDDARRFQPEHRCFLIGNKCDLESEDVSLTESTIQSFCEDNGFDMSLSMSAKSGQGVDACFHEVARVLAEQYTSTPSEGNGGPVRVDSDNSRKEDSTCCS